MNVVMKKMFLFTSVMSTAVLLSACAGCPEKKSHHHKKAVYAQPIEMIESDTIVVYQTYENADVDKVYAKMYTHSSRGGTSYMGHIKFHDTDNGLKMVVDLKDLRPSVPYTVKLYKCGMCANDESGCCNKSAINVNLPMLETGISRKLNQTYMIQGMSAAQLYGAKIYLERDGGYKAGWGTVEK